MQRPRHPGVGGEPCKKECCGEQGGNETPGTRKGNILSRSDLRRVQGLLADRLIAQEERRLPDFAAGLGQLAPYPIVKRINPGFGPGNGLLCSPDGDCVGLEDACGPLFELLDPVAGGGECLARQCLRRIADLIPETREIADEGGAASGDAGQFQFERAHVPVPRLLSSDRPLEIAELNVELLQAQMERRFVHRRRRTPHTCVIIRPDRRRCAPSRREGGRAPTSMSWLARTPVLRNVFPPREHALRYRDREDRRTLIGSRLLALATMIAGSGYIAWLFTTVNRRHPWMAGTFIAAEIACLLLFLTASFVVWRLRFKPEEGLPIFKPESVDVLITVCGEPLDIVGATLEAASAIHWDGPLRICVLDDGASDGVRELAAHYRFRYLSRRLSGVPLDHAKAGNLNYGLTHTDAELVLVLDADQVAQPQILHALAGYMRFPDVGFIQSRQFFFVPEGDPFFNLDRVFYEAVQLGYDHRDTVLSCGSGVLYRRAALEDIGGFTTWNVVEDLVTSYDLHSRGWRSFYYAYPLTTGLAPADIWGVYRQRSQWALDTMRLFWWDNPLLKRGLSWASRMAYLVIPLSYLSAGFVFPFFFAIPVWTYLTGNSVLAGSELEFVLYRGLYFLLMALAMRALFRRHQAGRQFQMLLGLFPVYIVGTMRALAYPRFREARYMPNNSDGRPKHSALVAVLPQLILLGSNAILPFYAVVASTADPRFILGNAVISAVAIWSLLPVVVATLGKKVWNEQLNPYGLYARPAQTDS